MCPGSPPTWLLSWLSQPGDILGWTNKGKRKKQKGDRRNGRLCSPLGRLARLRHFSRKRKRNSKGASDRQTRRTEYHGKEREIPGSRNGRFRAISDLVVRMIFKEGAGGGHDADVSLDACRRVSRYHTSQGGYDFFFFLFSSSSSIMGRLSLVVFLYFFFPRPFFSFSLVYPLVCSLLKPSSTCISGGGNGEKE